MCWSINLHYDIFPQHAAEGTDDEPLGGTGVAQLGVATQALHGEHHRQALGPAGAEATLESAK